MGPQHAWPAPADPDYAAAVRASYDSQGLMRTLGARLVEVAAGRTVIELDFSPGVAQQHGLFHGGVIGAIADNAGGYAAMSLMPAGSEVVTVEYKLNFLRPARGAMLRAIGEVVRSGKSLSVVRCEVSCLDPEAQLVTGACCAIMQATMMRQSG
jgi:uncharacterized protein (TIGR00369 family)